MVVAIVHLQQSVYHHDHITQQVLSPVTNQESARTITAEYPLHISSRYHLSCLVSGGFHLTDSTNGNLHGYFKIFFTLAGVTLCNVLCILLGNMRPPVLTHQVQKGSSNTLVKGSEGFMWCPDQVFPLWHGYSQACLLPTFLYNTPRSSSMSSLSERLQGGM